MKKTFLAILLFLPISALATSGACSGHGGVSCSSGSDSDGSVICNDGWRNSSVQYANMVMCRSYSSSELVPRPRVEPEVKKEVVNPIPKAEVKAISPIPKKASTQSTTTVKKIETKPKAVPIKPEQKAVESIPVVQNKVSFWGRIFGIFSR